MKQQSTRRESLGWLGAAGLSALGCGGTAESNADGGTRPGGADGASGADTAAGAPSDGGGTTTAPGAGGAGTASTESGGAGGVEAGAGAPGECAAKLETTVGPFPNLSLLERRDLRGNTTGDTAPKLGANLTLRIRVLDLDAFCAPLAGAVVDVWQCDAVGAYASYAPFSTVGQDFCRGYQSTDEQGIAEFLTLFPGSYAGRAIHIHFSIRGSAGVLAPNLQGQVYPDVFVAQLYFEPDVALEIFEAFPVYQDGAPITPNAADGLFGAGGRDLIVEVSSDGSDYLGEVTIGVRPAQIGR